MPIVKLNIKERPLDTLITSYATGRNFDSYMLETGYLNRPLLPFGDVEISKLNVYHDTFKTVPELAFELSLGIRFPATSHQTHEERMQTVLNSYSQFLYSPLLDDLNTIKRHIQQGNTALASAHLESLQAFLCGEIYG